MRKIDSVNAGGQFVVVITGGNGFEHGVVQISRGAVISVAQINSSLAWCIGIEKYHVPFEPILIRDEDRRIRSGAGGVQNPQVCAEHRTLVPDR